MALRYLLYTIDQSEDFKFFIKVATEQAFVCPFPFDIIKAFLKNRSKQDDVKAKAIRRRKRTKKTIWNLGYNPSIFTSCFIAKTILTRKFNSLKQSELVLKYHLWELYGITSHSKYSGAKDQTKSQIHGNIFLTQSWFTKANGHK